MVFKTLVILLVIAVLMEDGSSMRKSEEARRRTRRLRKRTRMEVTVRKGMRTRPYPSLTAPALLWTPALNSVPVSHALRLWNIPALRRSHVIRAESALRRSCVLRRSLASPVGPVVPVLWLSPATALFLISVRSHYPVPVLEKGRCLSLWH
jgi:hypothetical protein